MTTISTRSSRAATVATGPLEVLLRERRRNGRPSSTGPGNDRQVIAGLRSEADHGADRDIDRPSATAEPSQSVVGDPRIRVTVRGERRPTRSATDPVINRAGSERPWLPITIWVYSFATA